VKNNANVDTLLQEFIAERWKGMAPIAWGDTLREAMLMKMVYGKRLEK